MLRFVISLAAATSASAFSCTSTGPTVATGFTFEDYGAYKVINVSQCSDSYVLFPRGNTAPNLGPSFKYFGVPLQSAVVTQTPPIAFLETLGVRSAINVGSKYTTSACFAKRVSDGDALEYTGPTYNSQTYGYDLNDAFESIVNNTNHDVIIIDPFTNGQWPHPESSSRTICSAATYEEDPVGSAEWLKFFSYFFEAESLGTSGYCATASRYTCNALAASSIASESAKLGTASYAYQVPTGLFTSVDWQGKLSIQMVHYKDKFMQDAGATYPDLSPFDAFKTLHWSGAYVSGFSFPAENMTLFHNALELADFVIDETYPAGQTLANIKTKYGLDTVATANMPAAFTTGRIYTLDGTMDAQGPPFGGSDWFESRLAEPDAMLTDLIAIAHPVGSNYAPAGLKYIRHAGTGSSTLVTPADCTDVNAPRPVRAATCESLATSSNGVLDWLSALDLYSSYSPPPPPMAPVDSDGESNTILIIVAVVLGATTLTFGIAAIVLYSKLSQQKSSKADKVSATAA